MVYPVDLLSPLGFNSSSPKILHIDLNSCFASVEQQANPHLRGKPIAVAAYKSAGGCILAPSVEAKKLGIKTGMVVRDGLKICPTLIVLEPDPWKYRNVHIALKKLLLHYSANVYPKSIDEFVLNFEGCPSYDRGLVIVAREIKERIKAEIGEWLTVSIGISTNRYLAKVASGLHKPDGLDILDSSNYLQIFSQLGLEDLCGIKTNNAARLHTAGIFTVIDFYSAHPLILQSAFHSITGHYWYMRLHGWEVDDTLQRRGSYSNSTALGEKLSTPTQLAPVLSKLVEKMSMRMRAKGYSAKGVHLSLLYKTGHHWYQGKSSKKSLFFSQDIYTAAYKLLHKSPYREPVHIIAVSCFDLVLEKNLQLSMLEELPKKVLLTKSIDYINQKWGDFVVSSARMLHTDKQVKDRIAFGGVKELEELVTTSPEQ